jgi:hypothetical protein
MTGDRCWIMGKRGNEEQAKEEKNDRKFYSGHP